MSEPLDTIKADQAHDMRTGLQWWKNASDEDKKLVWAEIQRESTDPVREVIARFAQIGFTQILLADEVAKTN